MLAYFQKNMVKVYSVVLLSFFVFFSTFFIAQAATLSISPSSGNFEVGSRVTLRVVATTNTPLNAVSGSLSFPNSIFSVESVLKGNSILNFWVTEPMFSRADGIIKFEGVTLGGFSGASGNVVTINLRANNVGSGNLVFKSGQILANDGQGTDITDNLLGASFTVVERKIKPGEPASTPAPTVTPPEVEIAQPKPTLNAPEIVLGSRYGAQSIIGTSDYGKAQVLVTFVAEAGSKIFVIGTADADGDFDLLVPASLRRGVYTVSAVMIKEDKTNSETSNVIKVNVGNAFSDVTTEIWFVILLLILSILYLFIRMYLHLIKDKRSRKIDKKEVEEAKEIVRKSFTVLRDDLASYDKTKSAGIERKKVSEIKKDLDAAEKIISKEIKDISE